VLYQIYPRSFGDSNADGIGDLPGIVEHLDHLAQLGIDGIWLSPITASPNVDWGYDVSDFCSVHPDFGTMTDVDRLVKEAARYGIRVLLDLVPNHTSNQHPWFTDARSSRAARFRNWYVWADPASDGSPPNNWVSSFGGPAWSLHPGTQQCYLHNHFAEQPDLNWWNDEVRSAFDDILRFWLDRGVAGFRIDVCNGIVKDAALRDNPPATEDDDWEAQLFGQRSVYNANRPEVHEVIRRWRALADSYDAVLLGETPVGLDRLFDFYGDGRDELHLAFNFPFLTSPLDAGALRSVVEITESRLPTGAWPAWTGSNHDMARLSSRWAGGDPQRSRAALVILLCLRGTPVLYQGDEIGLTDVAVPQGKLRDPLGIRYWPVYRGRDGMRTPMPWRPGPGAGFTDPSVEPWLPIGDNARCNVEDQQADSDSLLSLCRDLIALRRRETDLALGSYVSIDAPDRVWAWRRGKRHVVAVNLSDDDTSLELGDGRIVVATDRGREGEPHDGWTALKPWEAIVTELSVDIDHA
jgi:alpha-glucosidase